MALFTKAQPMVLFDVAPGGNLVMPNTWPGNQGEFTANEWRNDSAHLMDQGECAMAVVAPNSINVVERAGHLTMALNAISQRNQAAFVAGNGSRNRHAAASLEQQASTNEYGARYGFFAANGLGHLATATAEVQLTSDERVARRVMNARFTTFLNEYGGTGQAMRDKRDAFKKRLAAQLTQETAE